MRLSSDLGWSDLVVRDLNLHQRAIGEIARGFAASQGPVPRTADCRPRPKAIKTGHLGGQPDLSQSLTIAKDHAGWSKARVAGRSSKMRARNGAGTITKGPRPSARALAPIHTASLNLYLARNFLFTLALMFLGIRILFPCFGVCLHGDQTRPPNDLDCAEFCRSPSLVLWWSKNRMG